MKIMVEKKDTEQHCRRFGIVEYSILIVSLGLMLLVDFSGDNPSYGVTLFNFIELLVVILVVNYFYCKKKK